MKTFRPLLALLLVAACGFPAPGEGPEGGGALHQALANGTLTGAIYRGGNTSRRVEGAVVKVNGLTRTTGSDGLYQFSLPAGTYTARVTKDGYSSSSVTRTVTSGQTTWGSMEVNPVAAVGTLQGKVYRFQPAAPAETNQPLAGAKVVVSGKTLLTDATGAFVFTLPPGTYSLAVTKDGYAPSSVVRTVVADAEAQVLVGLSAFESPDTQGPSIYLTSPIAGSDLDLAVLSVSGNASDDRGSIQQITYALNGGTFENVAVTDGTFSFPVRLKPGKNVLELSALDGVGNVGLFWPTLTFRPGVSGKVHLSDDPDAVLPGITVTLKDPTTLETVASTVTSASGAFALVAPQVPQDLLLEASAEGFQTHDEPLSVPEDQRLSVRVGLTRATHVEKPPPPAPKALVLSATLDGSTVETESVVVYGEVQGMVPLNVWVNEVRADLFASGQFAVTLPLKEGANTLSAVADGPGERLTAEATVTRVLPTGRFTMGGGCAQSGGGLLGALPLLLVWLRRRRS